MYRCGRVLSDLVRLSNVLGGCGREGVSVVKG